jgi:hypothetical protein
MGADEDIVSDMNVAENARECADLYAITQRGMALHGRIAGDTRCP